MTAHCGICGGSLVMLPAAEHTPTMNEKCRDCGAAHFRSGDSLPSPQELIRRPDFPGERKELPGQMRMVE